LLPDDPPPDGVEEAPPEAAPEGAPEGLVDFFWVMLPELPAVSWPVEEFVLVRSRLAAEGPSYEVVGRYPLK